MHLYHVKYVRDAYVDQSERPQWGHVILDSVEVTYSHDAPYDNGYETYQTPVYKDAHGNEYIRIRPIDFHGGVSYFGQGKHWEKIHDFDRHPYFKNGKRYRRLQYADAGEEQ